MVLIYFLMSLFYPEAGAARIWERELSLQNGCTLYSFGGTFVKTFPGVNCIFLNDGSFLSASYSSLRRFSARDELLWEIPGHYHHQLNLSPDRERVLAMASALIPVTGKPPLREDLFQVISLAGIILAQAPASAILPKKTQNLYYPFPSTGLDIFPEKPLLETTHFNSFFEVPPQNHPSSSLRSGDFVINSMELGIFIVSPDFRKIQHHFLNSSSVRHSVHDVQPTSYGTLLLFNNEVKGALWKRSELQEIDGLSGKVLWGYSGLDHVTFYTAAGGGVQRLDERYILYSLFLDGAYVLDVKSGRIVRGISGTHSRPGFPIVPAQNIRAVNVRSFLKARSSGK